MFTRRSTLGLAAATGLAGTAAAQQQDAWPSRPVTLVVPWAAGGSTDAVARILAQRLSQDSGRSFVVDNRSAAKGTNCINSDAIARPERYTHHESTDST